MIGDASDHRRRTYPASATASALASGSICLRRAADEHGAAHRIGRGRCGRRRCDREWRFVDSPSRSRVPRVPLAASSVSLRRQPALVLASPRPRTSCPAVDPAALGVDCEPSAIPCARAAGRSRPRACWPSSPPTARSSGGSATLHGRPRATYLTGERWYQRHAAAAPTAPAGDRLLLARVRHHRGAAAVLRRPRHPGRRPPQGGQRPRRADHRRRPALPARLLPPVALARRLAAGALPGPRPRRAAARRCCARRTARRCGVASRCPAGATLHARIWRGAGRPGAAAAARLRRRGQRAGRARGHRPALRRRHRAPAAARSCCSASAACARCAPTAALTGDAGARGLPHQRGPRRLPRRSSGSASSSRARPDFDEALEVVRAGTVFTTHTPVPAGIDRFPRDLVEQYFGGADAAPGVPVERDPGARRRGLRGRRPGVFNMAVMGLRLGQRANGVSRAARRRQPRDVRRPVAGLRRRPRCRSPRSPTACTPRPGSPARCSSSPSTRGRQRGDSADGDGWRGASTRSATARSGRPQRSCASSWSATPARRLRESWTQRGAAEPSSGWVDSALDPDVLTIGFARRVPSYKRLTLMLRDPERLKAPAAAPGAAGADRHRRQVAPGRRGRQAADPGDRAVRRRPRGAAPHRVPARLRHRDGPARSTRAATSG